MGHHEKVKADVQYQCKSAIFDVGTNFCIQFVINLEKILSEYEYHFRRSVFICKFLWFYWYLCNEITLYCPRFLTLQVKIASLPMATDWFGIVPTNSGFNVRKLPKK